MEEHKQLSSITYFSFSKLLRRSELQELLQTSRRFNNDQDVSGFLLYDGSYFVQYIEGEALTLRMLINRIRTDPRHHSMIILDHAKLTDRVFPDWNINFLDVNFESNFEEFLKPLDPDKIKLIKNIFKFNSPT